jgi:hypothetical protein
VADDAEAVLAGVALAEVAAIGTPTPTKVAAAARPSRVRVERRISVLLCFV